MTRTCPLSYCFEKIDILLMATCNMLTVIGHNLTYKYTAEKVIGWCLNAIDNKFFLSCRTLDDLYSMNGHAHRCISYYQSECKIEYIRNLSEGIEKLFQTASPQMKDALTELLDSLNDTRVGQIVPIYMNAIPDQSATYSKHAIFAQVNPEKFVSGFVGLRNESKVNVIQFIKHHYQKAFAASNANEFVHYYKEDLNVLPEIVRLLTEAATGASLVSKRNMEILAKTLTESRDTINRLMVTNKNNELY